MKPRPNEFNANILIDVMDRADRAIQIFSELQHTGWLPPEFIRAMDDLNDELCKLQMGTYRYEQDD